MSLLRLPPTRGDVLGRGFRLKCSSLAASTPRPPPPPPGWVCLFCIIHQCLGFINQPRHLEKYWGFDYSSVSSTTCQFRRDSDKRYLFRDLRFTMTTPDHRHQRDGEEGCGVVSSFSSKDTHYCSSVISHRLPLTCSGMERRRGWMEETLFYCCRRYSCPHCHYAGVKEKCHWRKIKSYPSFSRAKWAITPWTVYYATWRKGRRRRRSEMGVELKLSGCVSSAVRV